MNLPLRIPIAHPGIPWPAVPVFPPQPRAAGPDRLAAPFFGDHTWHTVSS